MVRNKTRNSILIEWQRIHGIPEHLEEFYGYLIEYKESPNETNYTVSGVVPFESDPHWNIENLRSDTVYDVKITPFRKYDDLKESADPYETLRAKTDAIGKITRMCFLNW